MTLAEFIEHDNNKNYCEILIERNGTIWHARPAHLYKLIELSGLPQCRIDTMMPKSASPIHWLCEYTGIGAVWFSSFIMPIGITMEQVKTLQGLADAGKISMTSIGTLTNEMTLCEAIMNGDRNRIESVPCAVKDISVRELEDYIMGRKTH